MSLEALNAAIKRCKQEKSKPKHDMAAVARDVSLILSPKTKKKPVLDTK